MEQQFSAVNSKGETYYLNTKEVMLMYGKRKVKIHYFSKTGGMSTACALPEGKKVVESRQSGLLHLKNI